MIYLVHWSSHQELMCKLSQIRQITSWSNLQSNFRSEEISPRDGVSSHLMKSFVEVTRKTFEGTEVIAVLSQIIPASERLMSFFLASLVKLPFWFLCVKKNRSPSLVFLNWLANKIWKYYKLATYNSF